MTVGPWIDKAWIGLLPDASRFVPEANRAITQALNDIERHVAQETGRVTRRFDTMARDANRALSGIGGTAAFGGLEAQAGRAAAGIESEFRGAQRDADRALRGIGGPGQFRDVERQADRAADRISHDFLRARTSASFSLGALSARASVAGGLIGAALGTVGVAAVTMGLQSAAAMEQAQISFTQLLGSGQKAKDFLADLNQFAATTPFELPGLIEASRSLLGAGQKAKDVIPIMTALGDATGALGLSQDAFGRIMLATTQAMNKGRLQGEELMQMQEAGLPVTAMLAKALGVTTKRVAELSQAGKLQSDEVLPKLFDQMHKDYGGSMAKQSQTLNGLWSTFKDTLRNSLREGFEPLVPMLRDTLPRAGEVLSGFLQTVLPPAIDAGLAAFQGLQSFIDANVIPSVDQLTASWERNKQGYEDLIRALDDTDAVSGVSWVFHRAWEEMTGFADQLIRIGSVVSERVSWVLEDFKTVMGVLGINLGNTADETGRATTAAEDHAAALRAEKDAFTALSDAMTKQSDTSLNLRQAKLNEEIAQRRVNDLVKDGKKGSFEYRQAQIDLERAHHRTERATTDYRNAQRTANAATAGALTESIRAGRGYHHFGEEAHDAGRKGKKFGDDVRDGILRLPKGRTIVVNAMADVLVTKRVRQYFQSVPDLKGFLGAQRGTRIPGYGGGDTVPIMAEPGEAVVPKEKATRPEFRRWAAEQGIPGYREGGPVGFQGGGLVGAGPYNYHAVFRGDPERILDPLRRFGPAVARASKVLDQKLVDYWAAKTGTFLTKQLEQYLATTVGAGGPVWKWLWAQVHGHFPNAQLISDFRPGAVTSTGNVSYHALGKAIDIGPPVMSIFNWIAKTWGPQTAELIFTPAGRRQIKDGHPHVFHGGTIQQDHYSHIHWAMRNIPGGGLRGVAGGLHGGLSPAEAWIIQHESGGSTTADNPTSTAFGLGQLLLGNRIYYGRMFGYDPNTTDYNQQLTMMRAYIKDRYGSAEAAMAFWKSHGWYKAGGPVLPLPKVADRGLTLLPGLNAVVADNRTGRPEPLVPADTRPTIHVQQGAVQIVIQGSVDRSLLPALQASVTDGLHAVLRELRTGSAA